MEINTRLFKEHFFFFVLQEKLKIQVKHHWDFESAFSICGVGELGFES